MRKPHKVISKKLIVVGVFAFIIAALSLLKFIPFISEYVFSRGISRAYVFVISSITGQLPFSVYEILFILLIVSIFLLIIKWTYLISQKRDFYFFKSVLNTFIVVMCILCIYTITSSMSYKREPLSLPQYNGEVLENDDFEEMMIYYLEDFRNISAAVDRDMNGIVKQPFDYNGLNHKLMLEYERIGTFDGFLSSFTPQVKKIYFSKIMSYQGVAGIAITPTGEANVNRFLPTNGKVLTMAHELAHIKGVMNENEANMLSYYLTITSSDIYIKYAGYMRTMPRLMNAAYLTLDEETYNMLYDIYPEKALEELREEYEFWDDYDSIVDKISNFFNDLYLKMSGVPEGVDSYRDIGETEITIDPDTGETEYRIIEYSPLQKMYIQLFLDKDI
ncbi:MAG: DUF3810 domain-containing protein [Bacillota bacterium]